MLKQLKSANEIFGQRRYSLIALACAGVAPLLALPASGQTTDPGRIEERIPDLGQKEHAKPGEGPRVAAPSKSTVPNIRAFTLKQVEFEGNTVVSSAELQSATLSFIGQEVDTSALQKLVNVVTDVYRRKGYFLSRAVVMPQKIGGGRLRITLVEGYIGDANVDASDPRAIGAYLGAVLAERPLTLKQFERALLLIEDLYGITVVDSRLNQDPHDPARFVLSLKLSRRLFDAQLYADNRGTESSGRDQLYAFAAVNSVIATGDRVAVSAYTVPSEPQELLFGELSYALPLPEIESWLNLSASTTSVNAGGRLGTINTESDASRFQARLNYPLIRSRSESLWLGAGIDIRHSREEQFSAVSFDDDIRALRLTADYRTADDWRGTSGIFAELSRGIEGLGSSHEGDGDLSRLGGRPAFTKLRLDLWRSQTITDNLGLYVGVSGQIADGPLLSAEEFGIGGPGLGRGYDYSEIVGDEAVAAIAELRYGELIGQGSLDGYQIYAFYDVGKVFNENPQFEFDDAGLSSTGVGIRLTVAKSFLFTFELAKPLSREVASTGDKDVRPFLSLTYTLP